MESLSSISCGEKSDVEVSQVELGSFYDFTRLASTVQLALHSIII